VKGFETHLSDLNKNPHWNWSLLWIYFLIFAQNWPSNCIVTWTIY